MLNNKDVIILSLFFLWQDVTTFYLTRFDLAAGVEGIFTEAAENYLCFVCRNSFNTDALKGSKYLILRRMD